MEAKEIIEKIRKDDRLLKESAVMKSVQKAIIEMGYEPLGEKQERIYKAIESTDEHNNGWIPCSERLPESEKNGWVSCIVSVVRSHYPTSTYDICDAPYDESIVMHANYDVSQKIWHLECDEQLNALIDIEDAPLNGDYVEAWQPLPAPYRKGE